MLHAMLFCGIIEVIYFDTVVSQLNGNNDLEVHYEF